MFVRIVLSLCFVKLVYGILADFSPVIETLDFPSNFSTANNSVCKSHVELLTQSLRNNTLWAYRMWDASAKLSLGLTEGSQYQLGNFDECLSIKHPFSTQYCLATITIDIRINKSVYDPFSLEYRPYMNLYEKLNYTNDPNKIPRNIIYWGICVPDSCEPQDVQNELQLYLNKKPNSYIEKYTVKVTYNDCQNEQTGYNYTTADYLFCIVIGFFLITVAYSTAYDFIYIDKNNGGDMKRNKTEKLILCFSARQNFLELGKADDKNENFRILYGIKCLLMYILLSGHSLVTMLLGSIFNYDVIEKGNRSLLAMAILRGELIVDIFFFIGALLNTYSYLVQSEKKRVNIVRSIILRYFRLVPVFAVITFFYSTLFYKMGSGPLWVKIIGDEKKYCEKTWWTNLLLLNNYIDVENMCIIQGWSLGVDFQLFLLSIPLNYLIKKNNTLCWTIFSTILFVSVLIPFLLVYVAGKEPIFYIFNTFLSTLRQNENYKSVYIPVYARMSTYILGMIMGFGYFKLKDKKLKISFVPSMMITVTATIIICICIFGAKFLYNPYVQPNVLTAALYASLHRPACAIAGGMLILVLNFGSLPEQILSWKPMIPLSKLSFTVYLTQFAFQLAYVGSQRTPTVLTLYYWFCQSIVQLVLCICAAFLLFILIENPCVKFMKEIIPSNCCEQNKINSESVEPAVS